MEDVASGAHTAIVKRDRGASEDAWSALWNGDEAHDVQATGMLSAIVAPLAVRAACSVGLTRAQDGDLWVGTNACATHRLSYSRNGMSIFVLLLYSGYAAGNVAVRFRSSTIPQ